MAALDVLRNAVAEGLAAKDERPARAAAQVRHEALENRMEFERGQNAYLITEHLAALAEQIVYVVGGSKPWSRPVDVRLNERYSWDSRAWLGPTGLRRVVLTDRPREHDEMSWWDAGEQAVYGGTLTEIIVILGSHRDGRFHGHWSRGWKHPRSAEVRVSSSSGGELGKWTKIWREDEGITAEAWAEKMKPAMHSSLSYNEREELTRDQRMAWMRLGVRKMRAIEQEDEPDMQVSQCHFPSRCLYGPCSL